MQMWAELCVAAGFNIRNMEPMEVYLTAGKIMRDDEVRRSAEGLKSWPEAKRIALRERVAGVVQFPRSGR